MTWFTEADVEAAARAIWAKYADSPIAREGTAGMSWLELCELGEKSAPRNAAEQIRDLALAEARAALAAIPDRYDAGWLDLEERLWRVIDRDGLAKGPSNIIAAVAALVGSRAAGFIAARDEIYTETARMWPEAVDLLDYIAALKPGDTP